MSDKVTVVEAGEHGIAEWGHVSFNDAIAAARKHFSAQVKEGQEALEILGRGEARVFHQLNLHAARNRREVTKA